MTTILAIETSCDETGVAIVSGDDTKIIVNAAALASQISIHALTGGVVPEAAAREHVRVINPLTKRVLNEAALAAADIDALAVTIGPGLMPALTIGVTAARTLAYAWDKPIIPVHHIEGHIYSALLAASDEVTLDHEQGAKISPDKLSTNPRVPKKTNSTPVDFMIPQSTVFPALALIVSGGHTMLIKISGHLNYEVLGQTRDDAAGEAFDKIARLLELPYPGGPHLSALAQRGNSQAFTFTRPMLNSSNLDFSFSGLKTNVLYTLRDLKLAKTNYKPEDVAASFQQAIIDTLITKTKQALARESFQTLILAGGVAANIVLRKRLGQLAREQKINLRIAPLSLCGDNAIMIGQVGFFAHRKNRLISWRDVDARARINIETM